MPSTAAPTTAAPTTAAPSGGGPTGTAPPAAEVPGRCASGQLTVTVGGGSGGAAGSIITAVNFVNKGAVTCTLDGHPGVSFVAGADGHQVGNAAKRVGASVKITLTRGAVAHATLRVVQAGAFDPATCHPTQARGFRVFPPDQTASAFVAHPQTACAGRGASQLTISPVEAGPPKD